MLIVIVLPIMVICLHAVPVSASCEHTNVTISRVRRFFNEAHCDLSHVKISIVAETS